MQCSKTSHYIHFVLYIMKRFFHSYIAMLAVSLCAALVSCDKIPDEPETRDRVLLYYAAGFNNLSGYLEDDIDELCTEGYVPSKTSGNVLLVFQNLAENGYSTAVTPTLYRIYKDSDGNIVKAPVLELEPGTVAASASTLEKVLTFINTRYISDKYGMIFSSHATGWIPAKNKADRPLSKGVSPSSIGNEYSPETGTSVQYEMDLADFADAIPMHLDYILFDACFMGGVEVAYQLKDVCDRVAFSQAEVIADGFDYTTMAASLLQSDSDLYSVCKAYYEHYMSLSGDYQSATVSLVDCSGMDGLASVCREIFDAHREELNLINPQNIQCFGRYNSRYPDPNMHKYFYDLEDILTNLNISEQERSNFLNALNQCIIYKAATPYFMPSYGGFQIRSFCGLSSYCTNKLTYDDFYKTLAWNQATGMIE